MNKTSLFLYGMFLLLLQTESVQGAQEELNKLLSFSNSSTAGFGASVDFAEDQGWAIVGAPDDSTLAKKAGAAYIFRKEGDQWFEYQKIFASDGAINDSFGFSVSVSLNKIVVGAKYASHNEIVYGGAAYTFILDPTLNWVEDQKLTASDAGDFAFFGASVDLVLDTVVIGAPGHKIGNQHEGQVYAFERGSASWSETQIFSNANPLQFNDFGHAIALNGNDQLMVYSKYFFSSPWDGGAMLYYQKLPNEPWVLSQEIINDFVPYDEFNIHPMNFNFTDTWMTFGGYVYFREGKGPWLELEELFIDDLFRNSEFGWSSQISDKYMLITAHNQEVNKNDGIGSVHLYMLNNYSWEPIDTYIPSDYEQMFMGDSFGYSISLGQLGGLLVSTPFVYTNEPFFTRGAVYHYNLDIIFKSDFD